MEFRVNNWEKSDESQQHSFSDKNVVYYEILFARHIKLCTSRHFDNERQVLY